MTVTGRSAQLQAAYLAKLKADAGVQAIFGNPIRCYEDVSLGATFPYITLGEDQDIPRLADCINGSEIIVTLHAWSRAGGYAEVKQGADAINDALHDAGYTLPNFAVSVFQRHGYHQMKDPDGLTTHAVITFRAIVNPKS
jgi:hypothetical protein